MTGAGGKRGGERTRRDHVNNTATLRSVSARDPRPQRRPHRGTQLGKSGNDHNENNDDEEDEDKDDEDNKEDDEEEDGELDDTGDEETASEWCLTTSSSTSDPLVSREEQDLQPHPKPSSHSAPVPLLLRAGRGLLSRAQKDVRMLSKDLTEVSTRGALRLF